MRIPRLGDNPLMTIEPGPLNLITDVAGILVGNAEDARVRTGVSVVLAARPAVAAVDVRGGAPGTRETDALDPTCSVETVDAVVHGVDVEALGLQTVGDGLGEGNLVLDHQHTHR